MEVAACYHAPERLQGTSKKCPSRPCKSAPARLLTSRQLLHLLQGFSRCKASHVRDFSRCPTIPLGLISLSVTCLGLISLSFSRINKIMANELFAELSSFEQCRTGNTVWGNWGAEFELSNWSAGVPSPIGQSFGWSIIMGTR